MTEQFEIRLKPKLKGFHLITDEIIQAIGKLPSKGLLSLFIQHTSAGLTINENADPTVRDDLKTSFDLIAPENEPHYTHTAEGPDDMPAHIKTSLVGSSLNIPITDGKLNLGIWQGIVLCEFRSQNANGRKIIASIIS